MIEASELRAQGFGFGGGGLELGDQGFRCRVRVWGVQGLQFRIQSLENWAGKMTEHTSKMLAQCIPGKRLG